ncbi:50S ribosomal protein L24 [candidate division WOR-3 bacterium JGI_Cruoil_03_51_56]|uniref:Large ribosomal subunit protein uL24 n=1 Tax=candidate division WOR-3 bacterium JGI_Cruoil_03_51_56 TaxID=1973747 RepID=A0A235BVW0_UNCW3|nr:MAG: 50S ribosomal protein L24 [candidate division WOR-3 bacterium JGI_Cruoil_03_51_56]
MRLRKGDLVEVITGEERGRRGKIMKIERDKKTGRNRVLVEGLNLAKKHQRTRSAEKPGGIIDLPNPIDVSNLVLLCPKCGRKTKVKREVHDGRRVRICRECNEIIDA